MMKRGVGRISTSLCKSCHNSKTVARGRDNKAIYVAYKGGKCERCGYSKCHDALEFHHRDPEQKDPSFQSMRYWGLQKSIKELDKCELLCSNCHREEHSKQNAYFG